jgi:hypothetical protein
MTARLPPLETAMRVKIPSDRQIVIVSAARAFSAPSSAKAANYNNLSIDVISIK